MQASQLGSLPYNTENGLGITSSKHRGLLDETKEDSRTESRCAAMRNALYEVDLPGLSPSIKMKTLECKTLVDPDSIRLALICGATETCW